MMLVINPLLTLVTIGVLVVMLVVVKAVGSRSPAVFCHAAKGCGRGQRLY